MAALPLYELEIRIRDEQRMLFGQIRKKWLVFTPEEYVRQCLIKYLVEDRAFPRGLVSTERGIRYAGMQRRYDLVVYDRDAKPLICCECKAPDVPIDEKALRQLSIYNSKIGARHLLLCNGKTVYFLRRTPEETFSLEEEIPLFEDLLQ